MKKRNIPLNIKGYLFCDQPTLLEIDYMDQLSEFESVWYNRFLDNYYNARFYHDGFDVIKNPDEQKFLNAYKARRREASFDNRCYRTQDVTHQTVYHIPDPQPKKSKKKISAVRRTYGFKLTKKHGTYKIQTLSEWLALGNKVKKIK